ncbi:MAG: hypothetical protein IKC65_06160, partial [Lentisphaeria bacterium]|nr:hypothetical protein [Lentisphaeria bacterium]
YNDIKLKILRFSRKGVGCGEGKNLFSREKRFFPSPRYHRPLSGTARIKKTPLFLKRIGFGGRGLKVGSGISLFS